MAFPIIPPGQYKAVITAPDGTSTSFAFTIPAPVVVPPPPPPPPPSIKINGSVAPATVSAGATITATVANGPGNPGDWLGVYAVGAPTGTTNPASWKWLLTDGAFTVIPPAPGVTAGTVHLVVPSQAGQYEVRFFPNNGLVVAAKSAAITVQVAATPPPIPVITLTPPTPQMSDTTPKGAVVTTYAITMSDGSPFTGTVAFGAPNFDNGGVFALVATTKATGSIVVNPNGPGVGPNLSTITDHITLVATS